MELQTFGNSTDCGEFLTDGFLIGLTRIRPHELSITLDSRPSQTLSMYPGNIQFMPSNLRHEVDWQDASFTLVHVERCKLETMKSRLDLRSNLDDPRLQMFDPLLACAIAALNEGQNWNAFGRQVWREHISEIVMMRLLSLLSDVQSSQAKGAAHHIPDKAMGLVLDYAETNLAEQLTVEDMARVAGLSRWQFARRFKATTGLAPHAWLMARRTERAISTIQSSRSPLVQIANDCGFSSQSHMGTAIKKISGLTPRDLRSGVCIELEEHL